MIIPLHMGPLHPAEQALTIALAFGPFLVLGLVIVVRRRHDRDAESSVDPSAPEPVEDQRDR